MQSPLSPDRKRVRVVLNVEFVEVRFRQLYKKCEKMIDNASFLSHLDMHHLAHYSTILSLRCGIIFGVVPNDDDPILG